ncbi:virulence RhuM family protein [Candidatus Symbiopectobacterium sp. NZEC127]|uniref:virulence RhuM family protein n=1 Tax=Candidatus Symbiopectobacterium sp. NZEC127 TaxID=2820472 RepID=UPI002225B7C8|nr:virulence RhuM family protein [Candidatus Symbiopectobacterium sp. NZEC127]MCW2485707.1 virulence RhuM family protein [Candidatus Symbiopectobacterium sp. NZEC127]
MTKEIQAQELSLAVYQVGDVLVDMKIHNLTQEIWATTRDIAELYDVEETSVIKHISNIYSDGELDKDSTTEEFSVVRNEGLRSVRRIINHYNLDVIISIGYRVNARKAIAFRQWASQVVKTYLEQGFVINEKALRESPEKVNELAAKVRAIRADEKQIYAKVRECFKISASDYDPKSQEVRSFYALLQDKFHHAITGMTSSKLIIDRADHNEENMGIYSMDGTFPTKSEAKSGKNYLKPDELYRLHLLSEQFLLFAESTALSGTPMTMKSLHAQLDRLLTLNNYSVFSGYTDYIKDEAIEHAEQEFELYKKRRYIEEKGYIYDEELFALGEFDHLFES